MTLVRSSRCRFSSSSALSFPFSSLNCRQGYIFVWRISITCVQLYFIVHAMLFSKSMRMWWDCGPICGNGRKDDTGGRYCISPNGQNSDGPIQCKSSHHCTTMVRTPIIQFRPTTTTTTTVSPPTALGRGSVPSLLNTPTTILDAAHCFIRCTFNLVQSWKIFDLFKTTLEN